MGIHEKSLIPAAWNGGFTLIELLIVVAIIAILAVIAVPNFLEAQARAKVARAKADLRTIVTGLESYAVDASDYPPNDGIFSVIPIELSTPIAYLSNTNLVDPFTDKERHPVHGDLIRFYTYQYMVTLPEWVALFNSGKRAPREAIDHPSFNDGAKERYGQWKMYSHGPDRNFSSPNAIPGPWNYNHGVLFGQDIPYDPTNGTLSFGNILRTQKHVGNVPPD